MTFQKKVSNILFSTRLTATLFIVFAVSMAVGTLLDRNMDTSPTPYTRTIIYNAWWFEAIMAFFVINFAGNIYRYQLYKKKMWATLILHLSFVFILLGAFVTRYFGFEGLLLVREGATENMMLSRENFVTAYIDGDYMVNGEMQRRVVQEKVDFSDRLDNDFKITTEYDNKPVTIELQKFMAGAEEDIVPDDNGESYLKIVEASEGRSHNHYLKDGEVESIHNILISLNKEVEGAINISETPEGLMINSPYEGDYMTMATMAEGKLVKDSLQPLRLRSRYVIGNMQMVFPKPVVKGNFDIVKKAQILTGDEEGLVFKVDANGDSKMVNILGGQYISNPMKSVEVGGLTVSLGYGTKGVELPFSIKLNDFIAERYPGTENGYSSYESKVTVIDPEEGDFDYRIYMNNILDHRGYRFFQSSFDPDELGTRLSVNHDALGSWITYSGYFMLYFGLLAILFDKNTRFADLKRRLIKIKKNKSKMLTALLLFLSLASFSQNGQVGVEEEHSPVERPSKEQLDSIIAENITPTEHADQFGELVIQDLSGRMMPMNTYSSEVLRKLSKQDHYEDFDANQVMLSMQESPLFWYNIPLIYLSPKKADSIRAMIGIGKDQKYAALTDFLRVDGTYKLGPYLDEAYKAQVPNGFQKEFMEADQRVNLLYNTLGGRTMKIFPVIGDENNKWISPIEFEEGASEKIDDSLYGKFIQNSFKYYLSELYKAKQTGDYTTAQSLLEGFKRNQQKNGAEIMLSEEKIKMEILYNKYDIFKKLFSWYLYAGVLLFIVLIVQIFKERSKGINIAITTFKVAILLLFILHTTGLIIRWYISGHAPWSDAYESMIYVAWATMFFGLAFGRRSDLTIAATAFVTAMILMVAHWNWMDPAIANLQPVLDSYWLMIHVAVIVASYGPFTLGMILGLTALLLMIFTTKNNKSKMDLNIKELTVINEMSLTVGLVMLTIGNFLGGMWANESWGRYWGWDPKETWALISIMIYAFVIHMRLVPGLRSRFGFNLASILAFGSIMMTYFGVNFYLSGLHSYASGDQIVSFKFMAITLAIITVLGILAYRKYSLHFKK
ncbi:cytochrome c-type biogenesis protein CcsB [Flavobacteriaceae bacterium MAR_2010_188]|nr:cytochrome c-type biogenesis protein CcsB [Flavobacteriaceae bacterium MAR_2010_188]